MPAIDSTTNVPDFMKVRRRVREFRRNPLDVKDLRTWAANTCDELDLWGYSEDVRLITSELVGNAVKYAQHLSAIRNGEDPFIKDPLGHVVIIYDTVKKLLRHEVWDVGNYVPYYRTHETTVNEQGERVLVTSEVAESGRGIALCGLLADRQGAYVRFDSKCFWHEWDVKE
ncbi:hypothetical protein ACFY2K_26290 [Kitasatospora sp. NPDC001309]|uniref:hypothetical protein n=1 Tax=Kitasatospora sp. NPDC001309 TaxID=3364013 RepID=UPI0036C763A5